MRMAIALLLTACSAAPAPTSDAATADAPSSCPAELMALASAQPPGNPDYSIPQCTYRGVRVYYLPAQCCDLYSGLLDENCEVICSPGGGIDGDGDGRCRDFDEETCTQVWSDPRGGG